MKPTKSTLAILMAALLTLSLTACSSGSDSGSSGAESGGSSSGTSSESAGSEGSSEEGAGETAAQPGEMELPLSTTGETLTCFITLDVEAAISMDDYNDNEYFQNLEERTGVHIDFRMNSGADTTTNFNLMIASNNLTDLITGPDRYADGLEAAVEDGYYLDLTDLVDEYMPNYQARRTANDEIRKATMTDSGMLPCVYGVNTSPEGPWTGLMVRQDWLEDLGLETPVTYDDWEVVLTAFKDEKGANAPIYLTSGGFELNYAWSAGYGVQADFQLDETGVVNYGPIMDGYRDYLTLMHDWYQKGLIDPDFMTSTEYWVDISYLINEDSGAFLGITQNTSTYEDSIPDEDAVIMAVTSPVKEEGDQLHFRYQDTLSASSTAISAQCENPELAMKWLDYGFTDEGSLLANYGIEGDTFVYDENGEPVYSDKILHNENLSWSQAQAAYVSPPPALAFYYDWDRTLASMAQKDIDAYDIWSVADSDWMMPRALTLTAEESRERASIMSDVQTLAKEYTAQFISGVRDIDAEWESYVSTLKGMGIDRAIEITQAAYDRYLAR